MRMTNAEVARLERMVEKLAFLEAMQKHALSVRPGMFSRAVAGIKGLFRRAPKAAPHSPTILPAAPSPVLTTSSLAEMSPKELERLMIQKNYALAGQSPQMMRDMLDPNIGMATAMGMSPRSFQQLQAVTGKRFVLPGELSPTMPAT